MRPIDIAVVGAGFAGLCAAIELRKKGIDSFTIYEEADDVGGTWRDNTYPGCACDVPSHLYSFSKEPNPNWTRAYSPQAEIWSYIRGLVDKYNLKPHIKFGHRVTGALYDDKTNQWTVSTQAKGQDANVIADVVVMGIGGLSRPNIPEFEGLQDFEKPHWHSARWNHDFDYKGKAVAAIGTGASAIQFVPELAKEVEHLYVFQRSPAWIVPKPDRAFKDVEKRAFKSLPGARSLYRTGIYWAMEALGSGLISKTRLLSIVQKRAKAHLNKSIKDPELREDLTPDYLIGCKRVLFSNNYYPALTQENVTLVPHGVDAFDATGVFADGQHYEVDAAVMGTGFHVTDFFSQFDIRGRDGVTLETAWKAGAESYYGVFTAGFPNFFVFMGPNTELGHNSIIFMIECQANLMMQAIEKLSKGARYLDVKADVQDRFNDDVQEQLAKSVWASGCQSWYIDADGKNPTLWPSYSWKYWTETRKLKVDEFEIG